MSRRRMGRSSVFRWPALVGAISLGALISGLLGEGGYDMFCLLGLALPLLLAGWFWQARSA